MPTPTLYQTACPAIWTTCVEQMRGRISAEVINECVAPLHPVQHNGTLKLLAPNRYVLDFVKQNLMLMIEEILRNTNSGVKLVQVEVGGYESVNGGNGGNGTGAHKNGGAAISGGNGGNAGSRGNGGGAGNGFATTTQNFRGNGAMQYRAANGMSGMNEMKEKYTFDKHVEGKSNQLARAAALQVGENPGGAGGYNPLFIYGDVGLGKTHLMQAAGQLMLQRNPNARVVYVRSELFVNDMINAIKKNAMAEFKRYYRSLGALLIDDIQFFARKPQSQEEFFHTFNALFEEQQQIIMTSDRTPAAVDVDARLTSRFSGGLAVGIDPPELETRAAILEKKALERGIALPGEVALFIAGMVRSNVRDLEGALNTVIATANFTKRDLNVESAREALRDRLAHQERQTSIENIQRSVAEYYKLRMSDLLSKNRARGVVRPRQLAMYFAKECTHLSLPQIGDRFGGRDHTTVLHACRKIKELLQHDEKIREDHRNLQRLFGI